MLPIEKRTALLKVVALTVCIKMLEELTQGVKCVSDFEDPCDISQPNFSRHLTLLRMNNIVDFFVNGSLKGCFLNEPLIPNLLEQLKKNTMKTFSCQHHVQ